MKKQSCFIKKNTKELRDYLNKIGLPCNNGKWMGKCLVVFFQPDKKQWCYVGTPISDLKNCPDYNKLINCEENTDLFMALSAYDEDTDINQWFICPITKTVYHGGFRPQLVGMDGIDEIVVGHEWVLSTQNDISEKIKDAIEWGRKEEFLPHRATIQEIIEHYTISHQE